MAPGAETPNPAIAVLSAMTSTPPMSPANTPVAAVIHVSVRLARGTSRPAQDTIGRRRWTASPTARMSLANGWTGSGATRSTE